MLLPRKIVSVVVGLGATLLITCAAGYADHNSVPTGTRIEVSLGNEPNPDCPKPRELSMEFELDGLALTSCCSNLIDSTVVPAGANKVLTVVPPTISGCTDSLGGVDTIKTKGSWLLKVTGAAPTLLDLVIPKAGAEFTSSLVPSCKVTFASTRTVKVQGTYSSSTGTDTVENAPIALDASGCTASSASTSATLVFSPDPGALPPW